MSESNQVSWRYSVESTFDEVPSSPTMQAILRTGGSITGVNDTVVSNSVRSDAMRQNIFQVGKRVEGAPEFEFAYGQYDDFLRGMLRGSWASAVAISAATISAAASDDSLNDSGNGFVSGGVQAGMWVLVNNMHATVDGLLKVATVVAGKLTFSARIPLATGVYTTSLAFTDQAAGATVTVKNAGMLRNGTTDISLLFEQAHIDSSVFFQYRGCHITGGSLNIPANALVTGNFNLMGATFTDSTSTVANSVTAVNTNEAFNSAQNIWGLAEGGAAITEDIQSVTLSLNNNGRNVNALGSLAPQAINMGTQDLTGELNMYMSSGAKAFIDKFIAHTASSFSFVLTNGSSPLYYVVTIPALKYTGGIPDAGGLDTENFARLPFTAYAGADSYQIQIDKISTT